MTEWYTDTDLSKSRKQEILDDIRPKIEGLNLDVEAKTCDECKDTIRLFDDEAQAVIAVGTFSGWAGAPAGEIDGIYCTKHKPAPDKVFSENPTESLPSFRTEEVVVTVQETDGSIEITTIEYASASPSI